MSVSRSLPALLGLALSLVLGTSGGASAKEGSERAYTFGFVPQQSARTLARNWGPILAHLSKETGVTFVFGTAPSIPEFEQRLHEGRYDFAYMNPVHYTVFHEATGYRAFAKQAGKRIRGILVAHRDAPLAEPSELAGSDVAFPAPAAFAASVLPRAFLSDNGIEVTPKYVGSHDSVYLAVARGLVPAGGGIERTFGKVDPAVREQLRVFWRTRTYTPHAFAAHPRIDADLVERVRTALVALKDRPEARALLGAINFKNGVEAATDGDWDDVRALKITRLPGAAE